jgi:hypothetical protein
MVYRLFNFPILGVAQTLWAVMFRRTLEIEFCFKAIDSVSLWVLGIKSNAPLSLYKVMSRQSGSRKSSIHTGVTSQSANQNA